MALPLTRDYDAADSGPLPATTVNNLQDAVVGAEHGPLVVVQGCGDWLPVGINGTDIDIASYWMHLITATGGVVCPIPRECVGLRLISFVIKGEDFGAGGTVQANLNSQVDDGSAQAAVTALQTTVAGPAIFTLTFDAGSDPLVLPYVLIANNAYYLQIGSLAGAGGHVNIYSCTWTFDKP